MIAIDDIEINGSKLKGIMQLAGGGSVQSGIMIQLIMHLYKEAHNLIPDINDTEISYYLSMAAVHLAGALSIEDSND